MPSSSRPVGPPVGHAASSSPTTPSWRPRATSARLGVGQDDHWLACLPLAHVGGLAVVTRALVTGTRLTVVAGADPALIDASDATLVSLVPTVLGRIDAQRWRVIVLGGSRPPADRPANTVSTYGMTETGSGVVYDGIPLDGVGVRIADDGEILLRGPMLLRCYRDGLDPKDADGWLATGDLGRWHADGRLHVDGRRGDLIISGGENIWPEQVRARPAASIPRSRMRSSSAVPTPSGASESSLGSWWAPAVRPTLDDVRGFVRDRLPAFMAPKEIELVAAIERTALGKPRRPRRLTS